jgi:penicillin amidase
MRRWVLRLAAVLAAVLLVLAAALVFRVVRSVPPLDGAERVAALGAPVLVTWDSLAIPHIAAAADGDAFAALGYLHARDRLWQMELLRRAAAGRLAEVLGPGAVDADRFLRSLDIMRAAEGALALAPPETRALLDAYVAGVNAWIAAPTRPLPPEFQVLRFRPEPWTPRESYAVTRVMAWDLVNAGVELDLARAAAVVGPDRVVDLFPVYPVDGAVIVQRGTGTWRRPARGAGPRRAGAAAAALPSAWLAVAAVPGIPALAAEVLSATSMRRASNSWVVGPARTASGRPILANDPHLELRAPALWYFASLTSPGFGVAGATIPGIPAVIIGWNRRIAWGLTNIEADDVDYVIERLSPDSAQVQTPDGWRPTEAVADTIRVAGGAPVPFVLRRTPNGPLVAAPPSGPTADSGGTVRALAMRWNGHTPSDEVTAILGVDRAGDWASFLAAARGVRAPEQNFVYADVDGHIGYTASGAIPVRRSGTGLLPTPGWTGEGAWERFLDFDELPRVLDPAEGFVVTANHRVIGPEYPWMLASNPAPPYRAERIRELLASTTRITPDDVRRMQLDSLDHFARWARVLAAEAAAGAGRADVAAALRAWDGTMGTDQAEPVIFWLWYRALQRLTFEDELPAGAGSSPFHALLRAGASPWFDDVRTPEREDLAALSLHAMREALPAAEGKRWGDVHVTEARHALGSVPVLDGLLRLNLGPLPRSGSLYTVNVGGFGSRPPFVNRHAASLRMVVDLGEPGAGRLIGTSGQSGNPLSSRYRDQLPRWLAGELWPVRLGGPAPTRATLRLLPAP